MIRETETIVPEIAAWHSLAWLLISNGIGLLLATLLLFPRLNRFLGEWTYGHWVPLHLNLNLYGWCSLPLIAWLFKVYQVDEQPGAQWSRCALWAWSTALALGAISWLTGHASGKLFLDWQGYALVLLITAMLFIWIVLVWSLACHWRSDENCSNRRRVAKMAGLVLLLCVPFTLYWAAQPKVYPPVNPDTGGPTGASLLESTLGVILIFLLLPYGLCRRARKDQRAIRGAWLYFVVDHVLGLALGRGNESHHQLGEVLSLGSVLVWAPLLLAYFNSFEWPRASRRWRNACFCWWGLLVASGWALFLPGLLDHFKFTDALVGHSHLAMAGFVSSLNIFLLVVLLGEQGRIFNSRWAFLAWQAGALGYVLVMVLAGWLEGSDPAFTMIPGRSRNVIYALRLFCGGMMTAAALHWWLRLSRVISPKAELPPEAFQDDQDFAALSRIKPS